MWSSNPRYFHPVYKSTAMYIVNIVVKSNKWICAIENANGNNDLLIKKNYKQPNCEAVSNNTLAKTKKKKCAF